MRLKIIQVAMFKVHGVFAGSPSASLSEINARQSIVALFRARPHLQRDLRDRLRSSDDVMRVVQKFLLGRGNADDVASISAAISTWSFVRSRLSLEKELHLKKGDCDLEREWLDIDALISRMEDVSGLERKIQVSMDGIPTRLGGSPETTEEGAITTQEPSAEDKWQQGYRWRIKPE